MQYGIKKGNPANMRFLRYIANVISSSESCKDIDFDIVLESRDNIYICVDARSAYIPGPRPINYYAILMCRRINASEIEDQNLKYHCQPFNIVYCIDCLYHHDLSKKDQCIEMCKNLIKANAQNKNDCFTLIKLSKDYAEILQDALISIGCYFGYITDDGTYVYIKPPILNI